MSFNSKCSWWVFTQFRVFITCDGHVPREDTIGTWPTWHVCQTLDPLKCLLLLNLVYLFIFNSFRIDRGKWLRTVHCQIVTWNSLLGRSTELVCRWFHVIKSQFIIFAQFPFFDFKINVFSLNCKFL